MRVAALRRVAPRRLRRGDLREAPGIAAGCDDARGAGQPRELDEGCAQGASGAEHQDAVAWLDPRLAQRQVRTRADDADRCGGDAVEFLRDRDACRAVGQQELGQPAVDARDQARGGGGAHSQSLIRSGLDGADRLDGGNVRECGGPAR